MSDISSIAAAGRSGGSSLFPLGGNIQTNLIDTTVLTNMTTAPTYAAFQSVHDHAGRGVHWATGPNFGTALTRFAYTTPRSFRLTFGLRF